MRPNEVLPESHIFVNSLQGEALYHRISCPAIHPYEPLFSKIFGKNRPIAPLLSSKLSENAEFAASG
jgi:hypothetical protein